MRPGEYATKYRQFVTQFPVIRKPFLVATGPRGHSADGDIGWTTGFFEAMRGPRSLARILASLLYRLAPTDEGGDFKAPEWYEVLLEGRAPER